MLSIRSVWRTSGLQALLAKIVKRPSIPYGLVGSPGVGKTAQVEQWASNNGFKFVKLLVSTMDETDISGIVVREGDAAITLPPQWYKDIIKCNRQSVLFLDELTSGRRAVLDTCLTLIQSRAMPNGDKLPDDTIIIAAMNPPDECDCTDLSPAMLNRFAWFEVKPDFADLRKYLLAETAPAPKYARKDKSETLLYNDWLARLQAGLLDPAYTKFIRDFFNTYDEKSDNGQYVSEKFQSKTTMRSLTNLLYFASNAQEAAAYGNAFVSSYCTTTLRTVYAESKKDSPNAVFRISGVPDADGAFASDLEHPISQASTEIGG